ncbi:MAG TPA: CBS domain-containing protein [Dehalococcoidia bacterium]|jgi:CBS domain-containing protein|nr:CBS domain-containing protein [Dehalococcoidia bacterium]
MNVRHAMTTALIAVTPHHSAASAVQRLCAWDVSGLPVVDNDRHILGVLTELDLLRALRAGANLDEVPVGAVMSQRPLFVEPETPLETAADLLEEWRVRRLPVCERGRLVGIISRGDVLRAMAAVPCTDVAVATG